jgi:hypothetical protein
VVLVPTRREESAVGARRVEAPRVKPRTGEEPKLRPQELRVQDAVSQPKLIQYQLLVSHIDFGTFARYLEKAR